MTRTRLFSSLVATGLLGVSLFGQGREHRDMAQPREMPASSGASGEGSRFTPMPVQDGARGRSSLGDGGRGHSSGGGATGHTSLNDRSSINNGLNSSTHGFLGGSRTPDWGGKNHYWHPCYVFPSAFYWQQRDIFAEIQFLSREGFVACTRVADDAVEVSDYADFPQGWKGYAFVVPPGGKLHVSLNHVNQGWFRMVMVNKWGDLEKGMLQNLIPTGNPEVTYINPKAEAQAVYVIADDPGWMSSKAYPYQLTVERSWDPATVDLKGVKVASGVWGNHVDSSAQFRRPTWVGFGSWDRTGRGWW